MNYKLLMLTCAAAFSLGTSIPAFAADDFDATNVSAFENVQVAHDANLTKAQPDDFFVDTHLADEYSNLQDIAPAAGTYEFEMPNSGDEPAIF